jgi:hypothetical protein
MNGGDLIDWIRDRMAAYPDLLPVVEPILKAARDEYGGDQQYVKRKPLTNKKPVDANQ